MTAPQRIADHVYAELDAANDRLETIGAGYRFVRALEVRQLDERRHADVPDPPRINPTGMLCPCGGPMVQTGACSTCQWCGESSGGCG